MYVFYDFLVNFHVPEIHKIQVAIERKTYIFRVNILVTILLPILC